MKQKTLLFSLVLFASTLFSLSAQEVLLTENISSQAWQAELTRLNPGSTDGTIAGLINKEATNLVVYTTPVIDGAAYTSLNQGYNNDSLPDFYFGKYRLVGAIESKAVLPCALGTEFNHDNNGTAVGFRIQNTAAGSIEFPELASVGEITIHVRNGNSSNPTKLGLEKSVDGVWTNVYTFDLQMNSVLTTNGVQDEILRVNLDTLTALEPLKLRLVNNVSTSKRFINLYGFEVKSRAPSAVATVKSNPFKIAGRKLMTEVPANIAIYNTIGALVFEHNITSEIELPASVGSGVFVVKSDLGTQKLVLK